MATSSSEHLESGVTDEDRSDLQDGKDKKKKIKPFEAFRRLFKSTRKRNKGKDDPQVSIVSMKAKSTTALHSTSNDEEADDDGGFKGNRPLQGTRSISEDSVFNPELKEANPEALKKTAVSEENLPKSTFQAELFAKIKSRQSMCSDEDDPGLPHSPTPPVTTADIIMGGGLKPLPVSGKSMSRESETSLISEDGSDNDEDDTFNRDWRNSVAAVTSSRVGQSPSKAEKGMLDFSSVQSTEILDSKLSKDKLSVKPMRRSRAPSRKKKTEDKTTKPLPGLKEESPTKLQSESIFDTEVPTKTQLSSSLPSRFPEKSDNKSNSSIESDTKIGNAKVVASTLSENKLVESGLKDSDSVSKDNNLVKLRPSSLKTDSTPAIPSTEKQSDLSNAFGKLKKTNSAEISESAKSELKSADVRPKELKVSEKNAKSSEQKENNSPTHNEDETDNSDESKKIPSSLRTTNSEDSATSSPKEDYKLKRQNRSKTLPGTTDAVKIEEAAAKVQRANSQRVDAESSPRVDVAKRQSVILPVTSASKPTETKRLSWVEQSAAKSSGEPDWLANLKKKKAVKDEKSPTEESKSVVSSKPDEKKVESPVKTNVNVKPTSFNASKSSFAKPVEVKPSKPAAETKTHKAVEVVKSSSYKSSESKQSDTSNDKSSSSIVESKKVTTPTSSEPKSTPLAENKKVTTPVSSEPKTNPFGPSKLNSSKSDSKPESKSSSSTTVSTSSTTATTTTPSATKSSIADRINSLKGSSTSDTPKPAVSEKSSTQSTVMTKPVTTPTVTKPATTPVSRFNTPVASPAKTAVGKTFSGISSNKSSDTTAVKPPAVCKTQPFSQTKSVTSTTSTATPKPSTTTATPKPSTTAAPTPKPSTTVAPTPKPSTTVAQTPKPSITAAPTTKPSTTVKDSSSSSSQSDVPAWRRNIPTKKLESGTTSGLAPLKIELIENTAPTTKPEKKAVEPKNSTSVQSNASAGKCTEAGNKKATSVLDMVKRLEVN